MIQLVVGVPGSGKTYFAVNELVSFAKSSAYKNIYTNINGLDIKALNSINDKVVFHQLDLDILREEIEKEYQFFLENPKLKNYDDEIKKVGILSNFYDSLIVIDECQMFLDPTEANKRFITYHRHFKIDLILITQAKHLLDRIFLVNVEKMIVAQPPAKRFFSNGFRYFFYPSTKEYAKDIYDKKTLVLNNKIFKYYDSGNQKVSKSVFLKMIVPIILLAFFSYIIYSKFAFNHGQKNNTLPDKNITMPEKNITTVSTGQVVKPVISNNNTFLFITCYQKNDICKIKDNTFIFQKLSLFSLLKNFDCRSVYKQLSFSKYDLVVKCSSSDDLNSILKVLNDKVISKNDRNNSIIYNF